MKIKTITPQETRSDNISYVIDMKPRLMHNVGIGYIDEGEASAEDFKKYPLVLHPWIDPKGL